MGIVNRLFGKRRSSTEGKKEAPIKLAFVLLSEARLPGAEQIVQAYRGFATSGESLMTDAGEAEKTERDQVILLRLNTGETGFVGLMPCSIPKGEADHAAQFSLSSFRNHWKPSPHRAHLIVTLSSAASSPPIVQLSRFTSLVAAVTKVSPAVGVYWGDAGATHDSEFFTLVASEQGIVPRMMLWSGVSIANEKDGRPSLLSLGMKQLGLPDLLLVAGKTSRKEALETMFDLLAYVAERGEALPEGDTVGRTADEKLPVRYVQSPLDPSKKVWRIEFP